MSETLRQNIIAKYSALCLVSLLVVSVLTMLPSYALAAAPDVPGNLNATAGDGQIQLGWTAPTGADVATTYRIQRSTISGNYTTATAFTVAHPTLTFVDSSISNGTKYYYRIRTENGSGVSSYSAEVSATPATSVAGAIQPHGLFSTDGRKEMCQYCHSTHTSKGKELLLQKTSEDTCYLCHDGSGSMYATKTELDVQNNPTHHKVPEGKTFCTDCHNPHFTTSPSTSSTTGKTNGSKRLLWAERYGNGPTTKGNEYCWVCHGANSELPRPFGLNHQQYFNASGHSNVDHNSDGIVMSNPPSGTEILCINCHNEHGSADYPLLNGPNSWNFCVDCHQEKNFLNEYDGISRNGRVLANSSNYFAGSPHEVAFYGRNGCSLCHEPHGTQYKFMLKKNFPTTSVPLADSLCFDCHDYRYYIGRSGSRPIVGSRFGNGNGENMHWHVTDEKTETGERPTCRVCHDPHGGNNQTFNGYQTNWNLNNPVNVSYDWSFAKGKVRASGSGRLAFVATGINSSTGEASGYSCYMTCDKDHKPIGYLRRTNNVPALNCLACHSYEEFEFNSAHPVVYPGTETGKTMECVSCHDPDHLKHTSSNPYGLLQTITWDTSTLTVPNFAEYGYRGFCFACHGNQKAIIGNYQDQFEGKPHSMLSRENNLYGTAADGKSKDQPCLVCHDNHASTNVRMLLRDIDTTDGHAIDADTDRGKITACMDCHDGYPAKQDISHLYNAPTSAGHFIRSVDSSKKLLCTECHSPHGTTNDNYLWDRDRYQTGVTWPANKAGTDFAAREFCLTCHPTSDAVGPIYYNTAETIKVTTPGEATNILKIEPMPSTVISHASSSTDKCSMCHDPHKPWPATGSNADCYMCHGNSGDATNIEMRMGQEGTASTGMLSKHPINDPSTADTNDCMTMCHTAHPHDPRGDSLTLKDEKAVCMKCHEEGSAGTQPTINGSQYAGKPHDYNKSVHSYSDGSTFTGNCTKCHEPHGSNNAPLLKWPNGDQLCTQCHNGKTTDTSGNTISDIKTMYDKFGHYYSADPTKKLRCAECHIPHGSSNNKYLRDNGSAPVYTNGDLNQQRHFPVGLGPDDSRRGFCNTCHLYSNEADDFVRYNSTSAPGGSIDIPKLPAIGVKTGMSLPEHGSASTVSCDTCHNAHDPRPTGSNRDCYKCHGGDNAFAQNIDNLAGTWDGVSGQNSWPDGSGGRTATTTIVSYHKMANPNAENTNTCMLSCHKPHAHNPKSDLIKDLRTEAGDVEAPNAPIIESAAASSNAQINVSWTASDSLDIYGYYIYRDDFTTTNPIGVLNSNATAGTLTFQDGGVTGTHSYKVLGFDRAGNKSALSTDVSATTSLAADTQTPSVPSNLKLSVLSSARISLSWNASTDISGVRGYNIYRSIDGTNYTLIGFSATTSFVDGAGDTNTLSENTKYYYKVGALDYNGNESAQTSAVNGTTLKIYPNVAKYGAYTQAGQTLEIFNSSNAKTNQIAAWETVKVKVTTTRVASASTARVILRNQTGSFISQYNMARTSASLPYTYEVSFQGPGNIGLYTLDVLVQNSVGTKVDVSEALEVVPSTRMFRTYSDSSYTTEKSHFLPGETVYVKVGANYASSLGGTYTLQLRDYNDTLVKTLTRLSPTFDGVNVKYSFIMPSGLAPGDWYSLYNRMTSSGGTTIASSYKQVQYIEEDLVAPAGPVLADPTATYNTASLAWTLSSSSDVEGYTIYRQEASGAYLKVGSVNNDTSTFIDQNLKPSTTYTYKLFAFDNSGNVSTSSIKSVTTLATVPADTIAPAMPAGVNAKADSPTSIKVSWAASGEADGVAGYNIYRVISDAGITPTVLKVGTTDGTSFIDAGLESGQTYSYQVSAFDLSGNESATSGLVKAQTEVGQGSSIEGVLCLSCHDGSNPQPGAPIIGRAYITTRHNIDVPIKTMSDGSVYYGNCTKCHVPHGSEYEALLKGPEDNELCFQCHDAATENHKYSGRRPYEMSKHALTSASGSGTPLVFRDQNSDKPRDPTNATDVVSYAGKCFNCHTSHGRTLPDGVTALKANLREVNTNTVGGTMYQNSNAVCADCHKDINFGSWYGFAAYQQTDHGNPNKLLTKWDSESAPGECANCHDPHGTEYTAMLKMPMNTDALDENDQTLKNKVCLNCHDRPEMLLETYWFKGGTKYLASKHFEAQWWEAVPDTSQEGSPLVKQTAQYVPGNCMNCHSSHGREDPNNPGYIYPEQLKLSPNNNELCYYCHDEFVLAARIDIDSLTYKYQSRAKGWPVKYDATTYNYIDNGIVQATTQVQGKDVYVTSSHGSNANVVWPGSTNYADTGAGESTVQYSTAYVQEGLQGYWTFDDGTAKDTWGSNNGTVTGGTAVAGNIPGRADFGNALNFDGNDYVLLPPIAVNGGTPPNSFTFDAWIYMGKEYAVAGDEQAILNRPNTFNNDVVHYGIVSDSANNNGQNGFKVNLRKDDATTNLVNGSPIATRFPTSQWFHLAITYDGSAAVGQPAANIYLNGALVETLNQQNLGVIGGETMSWYLGKTSTNQQYYQGRMDEVKLYNRPLSAAEIQQNYNAQNNDKVLLSGSDNATFAGNACNNCHDPHGSGNPSSTLEKEENLCLNCHDGSPAAAPAQNFSGAYGHKPATSWVTEHKADEVWTDGSTQNHVECADCHNAHVANNAEPLKGASGVTSSGLFVDSSTKPYEVCLKCHAKYNSKTWLPGATTDVLLEFSTSNLSHHGVFGTKGNTRINTTTMTDYGDVIVARISGGGTLQCGDCHYTHTSSNQWALRLGTTGTNTYSKHCTLCHNSSVYISGNAGSNWSHTTKSDKHQTSNGCNECHGGWAADGDKGYAHGFNNETHFMRGRAVAVYNPANRTSKSGCTVFQNRCGDHSSSSTR